MSSTWCNMFYQEEIIDMLSKPLSKSEDFWDKLSVVENASLAESVKVNVVARPILREDGTLVS